MNNIIDPRLEATIKDVELHRSDYTNRWYLRIIYSYNDPKEGPMELEFPRVPLPVPHTHLPKITYPMTMDTLEKDFLPWVKETIPIFEYMSEMPIEKGYINGKGCFFTTKKVAKDMTKEDIEKELGYPINIVDKKG